MDSSGGGSGQRVTGQAEGDPLVRATFGFGLADGFACKKAKKIAGLIATPQRLKEPGTEERNSVKTCR